MIARKFSIFLLSLFAMTALFGCKASASARFEGVSETGIRVLEVEASLLDVEVSGGSGSTLRGRGEDIPRNIVVKYKRRGDVLRVWVEKRFSPFSFGRNGRLYFDAPEDIELDIRCSSGDIVIRNIDSERLYAASSSGDISISSISSEITVKNSSGSVNLGMIDGDVLVESSSGNVELIDLTGAANATASSGNIRFSAIEGNIEASTSSGRIVLSATQGALDLRTTSGSIVGEDVLVSGDSVFESSSGNIDVDFSNQLNDLSFRLESSSGRLKVGNLRGEKNLAAGEGAINITGESSSGNQSYR